MLGPYNTSDYPITIAVIPLINIVVPLLPPYCYYCACKLLLLGKLELYCDPMESYI